MEKVVLFVSGWRYMTEEHYGELFKSTMRAFVQKVGTFPDELVTGGDQGADDMARLWAESRGIPVKITSAYDNSGKAGDDGGGEDEEEEKPGGKHSRYSAQNTTLAGKATHLIAFPNERAGRGTQDAIKKVRERGIDEDRIMVVPLPLVANHPRENYRYTGQTTISTPTTVPAKNLPSLAMTKPKSIANALTNAKMLGQAGNLGKAPPNKILFKAVPKPTAVAAAPKKTVTGTKPVKKPREDDEEEEPEARRKLF